MTVIKQGSARRIELKACRAVGGQRHAIRAGEEQPGIAVARCRDSHGSSVSARQGKVGVERKTPVAVIHDKAGR